jgi:uncharacterized repeat protein (TIGR01451 family)
MSASRPRALLILLPLVAGTLLLALFLPLAHAAGQLAGPLQVEEETTLTVAIHSSPIAVRDNTAALGPRVFVVHAVVTNTGTVSATELLITLDYQEDPVAGWVLAGGEVPERTPDVLLPGETYHAYWFAEYPTPVGVSHQYAVTASAANAAPVTVTDNVFGNPVPDQTVLTARYIANGSNGAISLDADIAVGVAFTMVVSYDMNNNAEGVILSPAGNLNFDAGNLRLQDIRARFHNTADTLEVVVDDAVYVPDIPLLSDNSRPTFVEITYTFVALQPASNTLCPYLGIDYGSVQMYDNQYCQPNNTAELTGTVDFNFDKQVSAPTIQQGETLTYDLHYTNTGTLPMVHTWIWDETDAQAGSIVPASVSPDPTESGANLLAWYYDWVEPEAGFTYTFEYLVDGAGADLPDGTIITNTAFLGINEGSLPDEPAATATVTTIVMAPALSATKSDGLDTVDVGAPFTYTIVITNDGSIAAANLRATDLLPNGVELDGTDTPSPPHDDQTGQLLTWATLPDLPPGESMTITIPVVVTATTPSFTTLTNNFALDYDNPFGHHYQPLQASDTTTVLRPAAFVEGIVFDDANGNGLFDTGETGIENVELSLPGAFTPTVHTDATGYYQFRVEADGLHTVEETDPVGYVSTTPNRVTLDLTRGETYEVNFGDTLAGGESATIYGTVFDDTNGNGLWDTGESGLPNVPVTLDGDATTATTTDAYGSYTFGAVPAGPHTVEEDDPEEYISTTPNRVTFDALAGGTYEVNFGDTMAGGESASIYGTVFADADGDGLWDLDEVGLPDVTITLDGDATTTTDAFGRYTFGSLSDGLHTVVESDPTGYVSTTPNTVVVGVVAGASYQVNFGDRLASGASATIHGTVFDDLDGDGLHDPGEPGIAGVTVVLDGVTTRTTSASGSYSFGGVTEGLHTVAEIDPDGYTSTTPNRVAITTTSGQSYQVNFGDTLAGGETATIYGTVFADNNADGYWDVDEPGLSGVTITLDGTITTTTDANGGYTFGAVAPGVHTVAESDPLGYISTTPNRITFSALAGESYEVNFGDVSTNDVFATIIGTVFADSNGNTLWDPTEPGIPNVTVTLDGTAETTTTDAYGSYTFGAVMPGTHEVVETDLPGYTSTTPNDVSLTASAGIAYEVNFGDVRLGTGSCPADVYEPDDTYLTASPLNPGPAVQHDFCGGDPADWHAITVERGYLYTFTTAATGARADTFLALFDQDGTTLLAANDDFAGTTAFSSQIVWTAPASGTYYLRITNRTGLTEWLTDYDVWVEVEEQYRLLLPLITQTSPQTSLRPAQLQTLIRLSPNPSPLFPTGIIDHCNPDAFELDDTWEQAHAIDPLETQLHTFDSNPDIYAADKDFVTFEVGPGGSIAASVDSTSTTTLLELYGANGEYLNRSGTDSLVWANAPIGRYYLGISPATLAYACDGSVSYDLTVDYTPHYRLMLPYVVTE